MNPDIMKELEEVNHFFANLPIAIILTFPKFSYYSYIPCHKNPHMWCSESPLKLDLHTAKGTHQNNDSGAAACSMVTTGQVNNFAPKALSHSAQGKSQQASTSAPEEKARKVPCYVKKVPQLHLPEKCGGGGGGRVHKLYDIPLPFQCSSAALSLPLTK